MTARASTISSPGRNLPNAQARRDSYALWTCRENVWDSDFRGKTVGGTSFPNNRFSAVFFQPFYAGQTFGLGQINPLTALMLSDLVTQRFGLSRSWMRTMPAASTRPIMDPDHVARLYGGLDPQVDRRLSIDRRHGYFQQSGHHRDALQCRQSRQRAAALAAKNQGGGTPVWPEENYYGWLINDKLDELKALL